MIQISLGLEPLEMEQERQEKNQQSGSTAHLHSSSFLAFCKLADVYGLTVEELPCAFRLPIPTSIST